MSGTMFKCDKTGNRLSDNIEAERIHVHPVFILANNIQVLNLKKGDYIFYSSDAFLINKIYEVTTIFPNGLEAK
ncbi:MAG: hypothetical protein PUA48_03765 [Christensenellaceae bacterium]|nr:hypothetical protein [Christensenellaceae bacterium]